jgi:transposase
MKRDSSGYPATNMSEQTRDVIAHAAMKLHGLGHSYRGIANIFSNEEFSISPSTVCSYVQHLHRGEAPLKRDKKSGNAPLLSYERRAILAGWMCVRFDNGQETDLELYQRAAKHLFGVSLSEATSLRYIAEFDLTWQMMGSRSNHKVRTKDELVQDALEWLQSYHKDGFGAVEPQKLWCIDAITDTERTNRIWTFGKKNSDQRKCKTLKLAFTSTLFPMVNAVGEQLGPAINTSNPDLDPMVGMATMCGRSVGRRGYVQRTFTFCRRRSITARRAGQDTQASCGIRDRGLVIVSSLTRLEFFA